MIGGACTETDDSVWRERGVSIELPDGWHASGFSRTVTPHRVVFASYLVIRDEVEGDCGGYEAVRRLPPEGAFVVLIDYGANFDPDALRRSDFPLRLPLAPQDGELAEFECFGQSRALRFLHKGRAFQAHIGFGSDAGRDSEADAYDLLNSLEVE